jgi:hypothetical protein
MTEGILGPTCTVAGAGAVVEEGLVLISNGISRVVRFIGTILPVLLETGLSCADGPGNCVECFILKVW